jgi:multiple antibiotic resistance protein
MIEQLLATFVTLFVVVDPIGVAPIFAALTAHDDAAHRRRQASHGVLLAAAVLLAFAFGGDFLLSLLGISLAAFRIAGGLLLLLLGIDMVMARQSGLRATTPDEEAEGARKSDIAVFPLAIPLIAGPGALTSVMLLMGSASSDLLNQAVVVVVLLLVLAISWLCLLLALKLVRHLGVTGINVITRVLGLVVAALAVQFMIDGLAATGLV